MTICTHCIRTYTLYDCMHTCTLYDCIHTYTLYGCMHTSLMYTDMCTCHACTVVRPCFWCLLFCCVPSVVLKKDRSHDCHVTRSGRIVKRVNSYENSLDSQVSSHGYTTASCFMNIVRLSQYIQYLTRIIHVT